MVIDNKNYRNRMSLEFKLQHPSAQPKEGRIIQLILVIELLRALAELVHSVLPAIT